MSWIFGLIFVTVAVLIAVPLIHGFQIAALRLRHSSLSRISDSEIPEALGDSFGEAAKALAQHGYVHRAFASQPSEIIGIDQDEYLSLFYHEGLGTWVEVWIKAVPHPVLPWRVDIFTPLKSGEMIATGNLSDGLRRDMPWGRHFADAESLNLTEQLVFHQCRIDESEVDRSRASQSVDAYLKLRNQAWADRLAWLVEEGHIRDRGEFLQVPLTRTLPYFNQSRWLNRRCAQLRKRAGKSDVSGQSTASGTGRQPDIAKQIAGYKGYVGATENRTRSWLKSTTILVVSVIAFAALWGVNWGWESLLAILIVLFVHESGHLLGMWLFGYKNLQMLFIPFLGAAVTGRKDSAPAWQEAIVLLLGPLPGLIIGLVVLANLEGWQAPVLVEQLAIFAVILNAFNLLPVLPLDGGRLVDLALFNRFPLLKIGFDVLSVVALGSIAIGLEAPILLAVAGLLTFALWGSAQENLLMRGLVKAKRQFEPRDQMLEAVAASVAGSRFASKRPVDQYERMRSLMGRLEKARAGALTSIAVLAIWFASLILPAVVSVQMLMSSTGMSLLELLVLSESGQPLTTGEWMERIEEADTVNMKIIEATAASRMMYSLKMPEAGAHFAAMGLEWAESSELTELERAYAYQRFLGMPPEFDAIGKDELHDRIVASRRQAHHEGAGLELANALYSRGLYHLESNPQIAARDWQEAREIALGEPPCTHCKHILLTEAILAEAGGDYSVAEQVYSDHIAGAQPDNRIDAEADLLAFYIRTDQVAVNAKVFELSFLTATAEVAHAYTPITIMNQALALSVSRFDPIRARVLLEDSSRQQPAEWSSAFDDSQNLLLQLAICRRAEDRECVRQALTELEQDEVAEMAELFFIDQVSQLDAIESREVQYSSGFLYRWVSREIDTALREPGPLGMGSFREEFPAHWLVQRLPEPTVELN